MARRGATDLSGILPIDKPAGMTSHDVVSVVRRITGERRIGHAGTLDPMATGVLVILVGPATRLAPYLTSAQKSYDARIVFGSETDTDDADGTVMRTQSVPQALASEAGAIARVAQLVGTHEQIPPAFSALKREGVTAHRAARAGEPLELEARTIEVTDAVLLGVEPGPPVAWNISLRVSKGTYVRAIARDLGRELGTFAHLDGLRRTRSGAIHLDRAVSLADLEELSSGESANAIERSFMPAREALELVTIPIDSETAQRVSVGQTLRTEHLYASELADGPVAIEHDARVVAIYTNLGGALRPAVVFPGGVT